MTRGNAEREVETKTFFGEQLQRRQFIQFSGAAFIAMGAMSCKKEKMPVSSPKVNSDNTIDFKEDTGLLNYLYALEQLNAAFYSRVIEKLPAGFNPTQTLFLNDVMLHELAHREFFKQFLGVVGIGTLEFDFSSVDLNSMPAVLSAAKVFKDLSLAAYNDAIVRCTSDYNLIIFSQIASVEARHTAFISSQLLAENGISLGMLELLGAVPADGLDVTLSPAKVLEQVSKYIKTKLNLINL